MPARRQLTQNKGCKKGLFWALLFLKIPLKPSQSVQILSKQGFLMRKTTRIPFFMISNLYLLPFWLKMRFFEIPPDPLNYNYAHFRPPNTPKIPQNPFPAPPNSFWGFLHPKSPPPLFNCFLPGFDLKHPNFPYHIEALWTSPQNLSSIW